jgi:hypothetical protein
VKHLFCFLFLCLIPLTYAQEELEEIAVFMRKYPNSAIQYKKIHGAVESLASREQQTFDRVVLAATSHKSAAVRKWCCYSLGFMKNTKIPEILAKRLKEEEKNTVLTGIIDALVMNPHKHSTVPSTVLEYLAQRDSIPPQDFALALKILARYVGDPAKTASDEEILQVLLSRRSDLNIQRELIRLYAQESLYKLIRERLVQEFFNLSIQINTYEDQGNILTLLAQMARYRQKAGEVLPDYGAWRWLLAMAYDAYQFEVFLQTLPLFYYKNKPLKDLAEQLSSLIPKIVEEKQKARANALRKYFREYIEPDKFLDGKPLGTFQTFETVYDELNYWLQEWQKKRGTLPTPPEYDDPGPTYTMAKFQEEIEKQKKKKAEEAALLLEGGSGTTPNLKDPKLPKNK